MEMRIDGEKRMAASKKEVSRDGGGRRTDACAAPLSVDAELESSRDGGGRRRGFSGLWDLLDEKPRRDCGGEVSRQ
ncbi:unnamed protein product [Linum trigynum]|uniref:Uncharacterized protein n=1 Tax=Linum trigynum TaxID=586398 RepID=A0AAV2E5E1_9ROSI